MSSDAKHMMDESTLAKVAYDAGVESEAAGNLGAAEARMREAAQLGHTEAGVHLGCLVLRRDFAEALRWWTWALERGNLSGAFYMAVGYARHGQLDEAERLHRQLVNSGVAPQCYWASQALERIEAARQKAATTASRPGPATSSRANGGTPNVPPATVHETPVPTVASPEQVLLDGGAVGRNLGGYSFAYAMGHLDIYVAQSTPRIGGAYQVGSLPIGEWFVIIDRRGFPLPVAIQKVREHAFYVRVDPAPLQGLRALASTPE
jgi:pentatricopeptide repeat protein